MPVFYNTLESESHSLPIYLMSIKCLQLYLMSKISDIRSLKGGLRSSPCSLDDTLANSGISTGFLWSFLGVDTWHHLIADLFDIVVVLGRYFALKLCTTSYHIYFSFIEIICQVVLSFFITSEIELAFEALLL